VLAFTRGTIYDRNLLGFRPSPQSAAESSCHTHQMGVVQVLVTAVQSTPPTTKATIVNPLGEIGIENNAVNAIVGSGQQVGVLITELVWHVR